jgi:hypothetical protein
MPEDEATRWRAQFLRRFPEDTHEWIGTVLSRALDAAETRNPVAAALWMLKRGAQDLRDQGYDVPLDWRDLTPKPDQVAP